jgi:hypothetical protein
MRTLADSAGPYDLSKFLNVEFGGKEHEAAIQKTLDAAHKAGKTAAIFCESRPTSLPRSPPHVRMGPYDSPGRGHTDRS